MILTPSPAVPLQPWQKSYVDDTARRKLLVKSVQTGGSFVGALECVLDCIEHPGLWIMLSASDRQSVELMEKVKIHTRGMGVIAETGFFAETSTLQHTATFPNRGRIIALPANADTARGYSGNVLLDEFGIHKDARAIWKAMVGRTMRGFKLRVMSSFKGKLNKFYELAKECNLHEGIEPPVQPVKAGVWSAHWVDIHMAVRQGLAIDIPELRATVGDEDIWMEEFENIPIDSAMDFISFELIRGCETDAATISYDFHDRAEQYAGMDIGRKRDLSVIWILDREPDGLLTRGVITMNRWKFVDQLAMAREVAKTVSKFAVDAAGIGAQIAEQLQADFPEVVEPVIFTGPIKEAMATTIKTDFENHAIGLPENAAIRRSIQAVKRFVTPAGNIRFDAARTDQGHADEFWALALARSASSTEGYIPASDCGIAGKSLLSGLMQRVF